MSASTAGALKAYIESAGLGLSAFRDRRPKTNTAANWVTVSEDISVVPKSINTPRDSGGPKAVSELAQVDLWQTWLDSDKNVLESPTLTKSLVRALDGARLTTSPTLTWGVTVRSARRLPPEEDANLVHIAITVEVIRNA